MRVFLAMRVSVDVFREVDKVPRDLSRTTVRRVSERCYFILVPTAAYRRRSHARYRVESLCRLTLNEISTGGRSRDDARTGCAMRDTRLLDFACGKIGDDVRPEVTLRDE